MEERNTSREERKWKRQVDKKERKKEGKQGKDGRFRKDFNRQQKKKKK